MKGTLIRAVYFVLVSSFLIASSLANDSRRTARADILAPFLNAVDQKWASGSTADATRNKALKDYLNLFTTSNATHWNNEWPPFAGQIGDREREIGVYVIEAMMIAEACEMANDSIDHINRVSSTVLSDIPTNALLFVDNDFVYAALLISQQQGMRADVTVLNSSRMAVSDYTAMRRTLGLPKGVVIPETKALYLAAYEEAKKRKQKDNSDLINMIVTEDKKCKMNGPNAVMGFGLVVCDLISAANPERPVVFMPSVTQANIRMAAWNRLQPAGLLFGLEEGNVETSKIMDRWTAFLNAMFPDDHNAHPVVIKHCDRILSAAIHIYKTGGKKEVADLLETKWAKEKSAIEWEFSLLDASIAFLNANPRCLTIRVDSSGAMSHNEEHVSPKKVYTVAKDRYKKFGAFLVAIEVRSDTKFEDYWHVVRICRGIGIWRFAFVALSFDDDEKYSASVQRIVHSGIKFYAPKRENDTDPKRNSPIIMKGYNDGIADKSIFEFQMKQDSISFHGEQISSERMEELLQEVSRSKDEASVVFVPSDDVLYSRLISALSVCAGLQIKNISIMEEY